MATGEDTGKIEKKNISDLVTCPLCLEYFQKPKLLSCGHSVCRNCLQIYIDNTLHQGSFLCPMCRSSITLPNDGVDGLTHSFFIVRLQDEYNTVPVNRSCDPCNHDSVNSPAKSKCVECCEYLCEECAKAHRKLALSRNHHTIPIGADVNTSDEREKVLHITGIKCLNHQDEIVRYFCIPCQMLICRDCKALDHTDHKAVTFQEAMKGKREDIRNTISALQSTQEEISGVVDQITRNISTLEKEKNNLVNSINEERGKLISLVNQAADKAIDDADTAMSNGIKKQKFDLEEARFLLTQMESYISYTNVLLKTGSDVEVLHGYNLVMERGTTLTSESVSVPDYQTPTLQSTLNSSITDGLQNHFTLSCIMCDESVSKIKILSPDYVAHYIDCKGNILQTYGMEALQPAGVAVNVQGDVVVTDVNRDDVIIFSPNGSIKRRLRCDNNLSKEHMSQPRGVCVDEDGYIFVSSFNTHSVLSFSPTGEYIRALLTEKDGIYNPTCLTVSQHGRLAVCSGLFSSTEIKVYTYIHPA